MPSPGGEGLARAPDGFGRLFRWFRSRDHSTTSVTFKEIATYAIKDYYRTDCWPHSLGPNPTGGTKHPREGKPEDG